MIYWLMRRRPSLIYDALLHGNREWMILLLHYNTAVTLTKHKHGRRILRAEVDQPATTDQLKPGREGTYENTLDYACVSSSVINVRLQRSIHRIFHLRHNIVSSFCQGKTFFITSWSPSNRTSSLFLLVRALFHLSHRPPTHLSRCIVTLSCHTGFSLVLHY